MDPQAAQQAQPPRIPTGQELFDALMGYIEPELTTEGMKTLEEKYKDETPEQNTVRKQRYDLAFERYQQSYVGYIETLQTQVERFRRNSFNEVELEDRQSDENRLQSLQQSFS